MNNIKKLNDDHKILRFLTRGSLMKTLGIQEKKPQETQKLRPTFAICSLDYYRTLSDGEPSKDELEKIVKKIKINSSGEIEGEPSVECGSPVLVSCWSTYQEEDLLMPEIWDVFPDAVAVVETTVGKINQIMTAICVRSNKDNPALDNGSIRSGNPYHGKIIYYNPEIIDSENFELLDPFFYKRKLNEKNKKEYEKEKEYRFVTICEGAYLFDPEIYIVKLNDFKYITKIYLRQDKISEEDVSAIRDWYGCDCVLLNIKKLHKTK